MRGNRGNTSLKLKRRNEDPMREYDRLPPELRVWLVNAILPWRPKSVRRAYQEALIRTRDQTKALQELDKLQERLIARDIPKVWGGAYPLAKGERFVGSLASAEPKCRDGGRAIYGSTN